MSYLVIFYEKEDGCRFCSSEVGYFRTLEEAEEAARVTSAMYGSKIWYDGVGIVNRQERFEYDCKVIACECAAEGYPSHGSNYDLRVENLQKQYPDLFNPNFEFDTAPVERLQFEEVAYV